MPTFSAYNALGIDVSGDELNLPGQVAGDMIIYDGVKWDRTPLVIPPKVTLATQTPNIIINSIAVVDSTHFVAVDSTDNKTYLGTLTNNNIAWVEKDDKLANPAFVIACRADPTNLVIVDNTNDKSSFSNDSGATYTIAGTDQVGHNMSCCDYPTTDFIIMGGDAGTDVNRCTDPTSALNWIHSVFGGSVVRGIFMVDASDGLFVGHAKYWETANGGVNITDTTHTHPETVAGIDVGILTLSPTQTLTTAAAFNGIAIYDHSNNSTYQVSFKALGGSTKIIKAHSGDIYTIFQKNNMLQLLKINSALTGHKFFALGISASSLVGVGTFNFREYDNNKFIWASDRDIWLIDDS